MKFTHNARVFWAFLLTLSMSGLPQVALAIDIAPSNEMISTSETVEYLSRAQTEEKLNTFLSNTEVQKKLESFGLSKTEIQNRLASLSDSEMRDLAAQLEKAHYGADVGGVLVVVVLVLLIIYLFQRI